MNEEWWSFQTPKENFSECHHSLKNEAVPFLGEHQHSIHQRKQQHRKSMTRYPCIPFPSLGLPCQVFLWVRQTPKGKNITKSSTLLRNFRSSRASQTSERCEEPAAGGVRDRSSGSSSDGGSGNSGCSDLAAACRPQERKPFGVARFFLSRSMRTSCCAATFPPWLVAQLDSSVITNPNFLYSIAGRIFWRTIKNF